MKNYNKIITIVILAFFLCSSKIFADPYWIYYPPDFLCLGQNDSIKSMFYKPEEPDYIYYLTSNDEWYKLNIKNKNQTPKLTESPGKKKEPKIYKCGELNCKHIHDENDNCWTTIQTIKYDRPDLGTCYYEIEFAMYDTTLKEFVVKPIKWAETVPYSDKEKFIEDQTHRANFHIYNDERDNKLFATRSTQIFEFREDSIIGRQIIQLKKEGSDEMNINTILPSAWTLPKINLLIGDYIVWIGSIPGIYNHLIFLNYKDPWDVKIYNLKEIVKTGFINGIYTIINENEIYFTTSGANNDTPLYLFKDGNFEPLVFDYINQAPLENERCSIYLHNGMKIFDELTGGYVLVLFMINVDNETRAELAFFDKDRKLIKAHKFPALPNELGAISNFSFNPNPSTPCMRLPSGDIICKSNSPYTMAHKGLLHFVYDGNSNITDDNENINNNIYISNINPSIINYENTELIVDFSCTPEQLNNLKIKISNNLGMSNENIKYDILYFDAYSSTGKLKININDNISNKNYLLNNGIYFITLYSYNKTYTKSFLYLK